uniref:Uncharacterized protein n=1 Tax=Brugia malayi TaxID=6279 RepID=A8PGT1_BRUMA
MIIQILRKMYMANISVGSSSPGTADPIVSTQIFSSTNHI